MFKRTGEKEVSKTRYNDGVHIISNKEYHASEGVSRSMLMEFKRSPYHYWYKYLSGKAPKEEPTPAMNLGNAVHTLVLEEEKFDSEFHVIHQQTRPRRNTPPYEKMLADAQGKIILTNDEYLQAAIMAKSVKENPYSAQLFHECQVEKSIYFTHKTTGIQLKSRPDAMSGSIAIDLKTTADASKHAFRYSADKFGYFLQAVMVKEALASIGQHMDEFVFVPVEKSAPYCVAFYMVSQDTLFEESVDFDVLMVNLERCMESNVWPGYKMEALDRSKYANYDNDVGME